MWIKIKYQYVVTCKLRCMCTLNYIVLCWLLHDASMYLCNTQVGNVLLSNHVQDKGCQALGLHKSNKVAHHHMLCLCLGAKLSPNQYNQRRPCILMTYDTVCMADCSNTFNRSIITTTPLQLVSLIIEQKFCYQIG